MLSNWDTAEVRDNFSEVLSSPGRPTGGGGEVFAKATDCLGNKDLHKPRLITM